MSKLIRVIVVFLCCISFLFIRFRESELFYDPLISFFKGYYQFSDLPEMNLGKLYFNIFLRYGIHMILSLIVLWMLFMEKGILKFAALLYGVVFILLLGGIMYLLHDYEIDSSGTLFYVRRFLIQPLILIILLPAFFYYRKVNS